jgi:DNA-binding NarL/FixJ family response regulator
MGPIRILLADGHILVRAGIRSLLAEIEGLQVVAEAGDGIEALQLIRSLGPNIVLLDIAMPGLNGLEVATQVIKEFQDIYVIVLSSPDNEAYVLHALRLGVAGYLLKDCTPMELDLAIRSAYRGKTYLSPAISRQVVIDYVALMNRRTDEKQGEHRVYRLLTPRQREILQMVAEGDTTKEITLKLNLSVKTTEAHRTQLMERLDIHNIAGLVRYATEEGIIE